MRYDISEWGLIYSGIFAQRGIRMNNHYFLQAITMSWMERTRASEAMAQLETMVSEGVSEAMGMRPRSARPARSSSAQREGWVEWTR